MVSDQSFRSALAARKPHRGCGNNGFVTTNSRRAVFPPGTKCKWEAGGKESGEGVGGGGAISNGPDGVVLG